jgi:hypothetical protein
MMDRYLATPRWVYWSLIGATAYTLVGDGYGLVEVLSRRDEIAQIVPAGQGARMFMRPFVTTASLLAAWSWFLRHEAEGSRVMALLAALFFGATAIVMVLSMQVSDWRYPAFYTIGYPLCALAFLVYAIGGRER